MTTLPANVTDEWVYIFMKELDLIKQNITQESKAMLMSLKGRLLH